MPLGRVDILRYTVGYTVGHDCGMTINPLIVDGRRGGVTAHAQIMRVEMIAPGWLLDG